MYEKRNGVNRFNLKHLMEDMEGAKVMFVDTETTGLDPEKDRIIELALKVCRVEDRGFVREYELDRFIKPDVPIGEKAMSVHGITPGDLKNEPCEAEAFREISALLGERPIIGGHNVSFDTGMLSGMYLRNGKAFRPLVTLDTMEMSRDLISHGVLEKFARDNGESPLKPYRLSNVAAYYGVNGGMTAHSAFDDIEVTIRLMTVLYGEYGRTEDNRPVSRVPMKSFYYWEGFNKAQSGIWVKLWDGRTLYYSTLYKTWMSSKVDLAGYDIDGLERTILSRCGISLKELGRMNRKRWEALKEEKRQEGAYL